jgi:hypothetical protein
MTLPNVQFVKANASTASKVEKGDTLTAENRHFGLHLHMALPSNYPTVIYPRSQTIGLCYIHDRKDTNS